MSISVRLFGKCSRQIYTNWRSKESKKVNGEKHAIKIRITHFLNFEN